MITTDLKKIDLASKLYVFYEAISGDLLFYSVTETLFLTLAKGFTAPQIALLFFISSVADLLLEYPSYLIIRTSPFSIFPPSIAAIARHRKTARN